MNFYIVVEGRTEKKVYTTWIPFVNPALNQVHDIQSVRENNFYIVSGQGYPNYFSTIENAIADVNEWEVFDRLVIAVDSEEMAYKEKLTELVDYISHYECRAEVRIIIQHFCFESWALGNRKIIRQNPQSRVLREYIHFYNVRNNDPEHLPEYSKKDLNRSQFALRYLKMALKDKYKKLYYSKNSPHPVCHQSYLDRLIMRLNDTGHIGSFESFLDAFDYPKG